MLATKVSSIDQHLTPVVQSGLCSDHGRVPLKFRAEVMPEGVELVQTLVQVLAQNAATLHESEPRTSTPKQQSIDETLVASMIHSHRLYLSTTNVAPRGEEVSIRSGAARGGSLSRAGSVLSGSRSPPRCESAARVSPFGNGGDASTATGMYSPSKDGRGLPPTGLGKKLRAVK